MRILFNQKFKITAFITTLLVISLINKHPIQQQQIVQNLSLSQIGNPPTQVFSDNLPTSKPSDINAKIMKNPYFIQLLMNGKNISIVLTLIKY